MVFWQKALLAAIAAVGLGTSAQGQQPDARQLLATIISAFQNCGPPQAFQWLGAQLYQAVFQQTGGTGCYWPIRQAGPISSMRIMSQQQFPAGPIYQIRVQHQSGAVDWFIGISQFTGRIEYLNYQAAQPGPPPDIDSGPKPDGGPSPGPDSNPGPNDPSDGCSLYPSMCVQ